MDVLSDVLRTLRLSGTVYFEADFGAPWGMDIKGGAFANFHLVVDGQCLVTGPDGGVELGRGDVVVFPHGARHSIASDPSAPVPPAEVVMESGTTADGKRRFGGGGATTTLICGHFDYERAGAHPLLGALPGCIVVRGTDQRAEDWLRTATQLTAAESRSDRMGAAAVVDRLAEVLLIQLIRAHADTVDKESFLSAIRDRNLAAALQLIHAAPASTLSVERLAREAHLSRTVFAERFKASLGRSPMHYVTEWRMHRARERLVESDDTIASIAESVGYRSEFAFAKAFKRFFDEGPGTVRRRLRRSAAS